MNGKRIKGDVGLMLAIVFLLVETTTRLNRMRAILSITILLTMICYNIKTNPCYVDIASISPPFCSILALPLLIYHARLTFSGQVLLLVFFGHLPW